ncbi:phosphotransferase enzyme family protein [Alistipes sp.]|uniref:phosphotransferase enzyme family protein n=1 Tax=Alistipes sp. TaxID=1872444 RepID=UPI003AEF16DB
MKTHLQEIASHFALAGPVLKIDSLGEGFINDTFIVRTAGDAPDYILQRKNKTIFRDVPAMMENIRKVTEHIRRRVAAAGGDPEREAMTVVPTLDGKLCYLDSDGEYWAVTLFIDDTAAYNRADSPELARKGGEGIGKFQAQLADFTEPLAETIPGFHNIRHRFAQWDEALRRDAAGRVGELPEEIGWIEARRAEMLAFWSLVEDGIIPTRVTHNDTKINNILFDRQGEVLCAIDLDTVMNSTSLNDFGDAIRSYCNTGDEDDRDLARVGLSLEMFRAYTDGYLSQRARQLAPSEIDHLAFSARYITFEQVLRFLMDYIDGDTYYKIRYPEHNLVRTHAQYRLLESMEEHYPEMCRIVCDTAAKYR